MLQNSVALYLVLLAAGHIYVASPIKRKVVFSASGVELDFESCRLSLFWQHKGWWVFGLLVDMCVRCVSVAVENAAKWAGARA